MLTAEAAVDGSAEGFVTGEPFWLEVAPEPVYGVLHSPPSTETPRVAALILPTFGPDAELSYRPCRDWATKLAESGVPTVRMDYPGTENSVGSPLAPNRFQSWVDAAAQMADWLRERTGCARVVAIGIGLGGFVGYQVAAANGPIDDLVLWGVRASGRAYLRELRAFAAMLSGDSSEARDSERDDGVTWIGGYPMSAETAAAVSAINLASTPLPQAEARRVLLIGRDAHGIDDKLRRSLEESGAALELLEADDYHRLIAEPDFGWTPDKTILASIDWLHSSADHQVSAVRHDRRGNAPRVLNSVGFEYDGAGIREQLHMLDTPKGRIVGITSEPVAGPRAPYGLVVVNAGALRHTAPSRMFVEITRRAAARGIFTARFDLPGLGDSDGTWVRTFERRATDDAEPLAAVKAIYDHLQELGVADRFLSMGLCLGGYFAVRASVEDARSLGAIALNIPAFKWTDAERKRGIRWFAGLSSQLLATTEPADDGSGGRLELAGQRLVRLFHSTRWRLTRQLGDVDALWRFQNRGGIAAAGKTLNHLGKNEAKVLLLMGNKEPGLRMLDVPRVRRKLERWPNIQLERLPTGDHNLRPPEIQDLFFDLALLALAEVAGVDAEPIGASGQSAQ